MGNQRHNDEVRYYRVNGPYLDQVKADKEGYASAYEAFQACVTRRTQWYEKGTEAFKALGIPMYSSSIYKQRFVGVETTPDFDEALWKVVSGSQGVAMEPRKTVSSLVPQERKADVRRALKKLKTDWDAALREMEDIEFDHYVLPETVGVNLNDSGHLRIKVRTRHDTQTLYVRTNANLDPHVGAIEITVSEFEDAAQQPEE